MLIFLSGCANVVTPSGGNKDTTPPKVVKSSPINNTRNFNSTTLTLDFDEYVVLNNATQNVRFSPPLKQTPTYSVRGKRLTIKLKEQLAPNTTYSMMLGDAIKDLHEGNILKDYILVFATVDIVDTLSIGGCVLDAQTKKPKEKVWAQLYKSTDSITHNPDYLVQTDNEGRFRFDGLSEGLYTLIALDDKNSNNLYDLASEGIAFCNEQLAPVYAPAPDSTNNALNIEMLMFVHPDSTQQLLKAEAVGKGCFRFAFLYPASDNDVVLVGSDTLANVKVWSANHDTVNFFFNKTIDTIAVRLTIDTTTKTQKYPVKVRNKRNVKENTNLIIKSNLVKGVVGPTDEFTLMFDEPIERVTDRDSILFVVAGDSLYNIISFTKIDDYGFKYSINQYINFDTTYTLIVPDSLFFSVCGKTNKTTKLDIKRSKYSDFGSLFIKVVLPPDVPQIVVDLVNENDKIIATQIVTTNSELKFLDLAPTKYKLRALLDSDANGVWTPGDYDRRLQSEKIIYHPQTFDIKADWDIDMEEAWLIEK